ncbi:immunity 51 family protein [Ruminococcaceae bacterium OttesenSCG-928-N02]|nr:immunity 51 family protein [Ruminococcaceae bacterium OttesenSCG-928-N02]
MREYVKVSKNKNQVAVWFYNEADKVLAIGEKMYAINDRAYMNGYNWDMFFNYYLGKHAPDILNALEADPEAGSYVAFFAATPEGETLAVTFAKIIEELVEDEERLYKIVREEGDEIEWD